MYKRLTTDGSRAEEFEKYYVLEYRDPKADTGGLSPVFGEHIVGREFAPSSRPVEHQNEYRDAD